MFGMSCEHCATGRAANLARSACDDISTGGITDVGVIDAIISGNNTNVLPKTTFGLLLDQATLAEPEALQLLLTTEIAAAIGATVAQISVSGIAASDGERRRLQVQATFDVVLLGREILLLDLIDAVSDPEGPLMTGAAGSLIDPTVTPTFSFVCPIGMYRHQGSFKCARCAGRAIPDPLTAFESCKDCVPGRAPAEETFDKCVCDRNYFNSSYSRAQVSMVKCYEENQRYLPDSELEPATDECMICGESMQNVCIDCTLGKTTMLPGFSLSQTKLAQGVALDDIVGQRSVYQCPMGTDTCTGDPNQPCHEGYSGPLCALCAEGYSRRGLQGACEECAEGLSVLWVIMGFVMVIALATAALWFFSGVSEVHGRLHTVIVFSKIAIGLVQIITQLEVALQLQWPPIFRWFVDLLKIFSFDMLAFLDIGCLTTCANTSAMVVPCTVFLKLLTHLFCDRYSYYEKFQFAFLPGRNRYGVLGVT